MKRTLSSLILLTLTAASILLCLAVIADRPNKSLNGFSRKIIPREFSVLREWIFSEKVMAVAGIHANTIYLSTPDPARLLAWDLVSGKVQMIQLSLPAARDPNENFHTTVRYPNYYITGTNSRRLIVVNLLASGFAEYDIPTGPVLSTIITDSNHALLRCVDTVKHILEFVAFDFRRKEIIQRRPVLVNRDPSIYANDGMLSLDKENMNCWYTHFYSNAMLLVSPSKLNMRKWKTIDTNNIPKIGSARIGDAIAISKASTNINLANFAYKGKLYVQSALMADNENIRDFRDYAVIDLYDPAYSGSFYLPLSKEKLKQFMFDEKGNLITLLDDRILVFEQSD